MKNTNIVEQLSKFSFDRFQSKIKDDKYYYINFVMPVLHIGDRVLNKQIIGCILTEVKLSHSKTIISKEILTPNNELSEMLSIAQGSGISDGKSIKKEFSKADKKVFGMVVELPRKNKKINFIGLCLEALLLGVKK